MDYSQITDNLFVGNMPSASDHETLNKRGVRLIINMRFLHGKPPKDGEPRIEYLRLRTFDSPLLPIPVEALMRGAEAALAVMRSGGAVYVHCARGRHRGPAMAAAILIAQGMGPEQAIQLIKERRREADPGVRYIRRRIWLFAERWSERIEKERG